MASVYLLSAGSTDRELHPKAFLDLEQMQTSARVDRFGAHEVVDGPDQADLILFVETSAAAGHYFERVRSHPICEESRSNSYLFCSTDKVIPFLPGVYASIEQRWSWPAWTRSGHYLGVREHADRRYDPEHLPAQLYSFVGAANTHPVRRRIMDLQHPRAILIDSHSESLAINRGDRPAIPPEEYSARYVRAIRDCSFVLCPRGGGGSSFRLFETMMLGRVPVIISDQWVPPTGPDWGSCSLRVPESRVGDIPALLEAHRRDARAMGELARQTWLDWFSPEASFHRSIEWCLALAGSATAREGRGRYLPYLQLLRPYHAARSVAKRLGHRQSPPDGPGHAPPPAPEPSKRCRGGPS